MGTRIDAHQHFWNYRPETHPWITDSMPALKRDFLPEDLRPELTAAAFDGCVAVQAQHDTAETTWLLQLAEKHEFIRGVVGWIDLCAADVEEELERLSAQRLLSGVRHIVQDEADDRFMLRSDFQNGIGALARHGLTYDILVYEHQLPHAVELARRFPEQPFVLDHIGKPRIREGSFDAWRLGVAELARCPNAYCKLSGLATEADWEHWRRSDFTPYLDVVLAAFGPERLMAGSDWPVCLLAGGYQKTIAIVTEFIAALTAAEQEAILGLNAIRFYGLAS